MAGRGGHVQRIARAMAGVPAGRPRGELARYLEELWAVGLMPASQAQKIAKLATEDHDGSPQDLVKLASIGANGKFTNNCHRDLVRRLSASSPMPQPVLHELPIKNLKKRSLDEQSMMRHGVAIMAPHEVFASLWVKAPKLFAQRFLGCEDANSVATVLTQFWSMVPESDPRKSMLRAAWAKRGDGQPESALRQRAVPLAVHGDAVPIGAKVSYDAVSWSGLLGRSLSTLDQKVLVGGLVTKLVGDGTENEHWQAIVWSLMTLWMGIFPEHDALGEPWPAGSRQREAQGKPLASGLVGVIWVIKADMDWLANGLGLQHSSSKFPCCWCQANRFQTGEEPDAVMFNIVPRPLFDHSPTAAWRESTWKDAQKWRESLGNTHALFYLPNVAIFTVRADTMHIADLGVSHHILGNVLYHACYCSGNRFGGTPAARLEFLFDRISILYRARNTPNQVHNLTLSMFTDPDAHSLTHPCLSTRVKAAEARHLVPIVAALWKDLRNGTIIEKHIGAVLDAMSTFYSTLKAHEDTYLLPPAGLRALRKSGELVLTHYNALSDLARAGSHPMTWHQVPKFHGLAHVMLQAEHQNPVWAWCYVDEDFMGIVKDIAESCTVATPLCDVPEKICEKWRLGWGLRLTHQLDDA